MRRKKSVICIALFFLIVSLSLLSLSQFSLFQQFFLGKGLKSNASNGAVEIATTKTDTGGLGGHIGNLQYVNGLYWVFVSDGKNLMYSTSVDGTLWTKPEVIPLANSCATNRNGVDFAVNGTTLWYICGQDVIDDSHFYYRNGTLNANGSITWLTPQQSVPTFGNTVVPSAITFDSNGNVWVCIGTALNPNYQEEIYYYHNNRWTSSTVVTNPISDGIFGGPESLLPLSGGKMTLLTRPFNHSVGTWQNRVCSGIGCIWTPPVSGNTKLEHRDSSSAVVGDTVFLGGSDEKSGVWYTYFSYSNTTWSSLQTPASLVGGAGSGGTMQTEGNALYFYTLDPAIGELNFTTASVSSLQKLGNSAWSTPVTLATGLTGSINVRFTGLNDEGSTKVAGQPIGLVWVTGKSSPYKIMFYLASTNTT